MVVGIVSCTTHETAGPNQVPTPWSEDENCPLELVIGGAVVFGGLRLWEMVDLWVGPPIHNSRLRELRRRQNQSHYGIAFVPTGSSSGVAMLSLRF